MTKEAIIRALRNEHFLDSLRGRQQAVPPAPPVGRAKSGGDGVSSSLGAPHGSSAGWLGFVTHDRSRFPSS